MLSLALVLFVAGVVCLVRDSRVKGSRRVVDAPAADHLDLERMFELPSRSPRQSRTA